MPTTNYKILRVNQVHLQEIRYLIRDEYQGYEDLSETRNNVGMRVLSYQDEWITFLCNLREIIIAFSTKCFKDQHQNAHL